MEDKVEIGARFEEVLIMLGLNERGGATKLAKITGYSKPQVSAFISGKRPLNDRFLKLLESTLHVNPDYILNGNLPVIFPHVRSTGIVNLDELHKALPENMSKALSEFMDKDQIERDKIRNDIIAVLSYLSVSQLKLVDNFIRELIGESSK